MEYEWKPSLKMCCIFLIKSINFKYFFIKGIIILFYKKIPYFSYIFYLYLLSYYFFTIIVCYSSQFLVCLCSFSGILDFWCSLLLVSRYFGWSFALNSPFSCCSDYTVKEENNVCIKIFSWAKYTRQNFQVLLEN